MPSLFTDPPLSVFTTRPSGKQQWEAAINEQRQHDLTKPSMPEQILGIAGDTAQILGAPIINSARRMQQAYEGGLDANMGGAQLLDLMALAGGTAGAAERGTVGALGGKPGMMAAAQKAAPLTGAKNIAAPGFEHPNADARTELMNVLYPGREEAKNATARSAAARDTHQMEQENGFYLVNDPESRARMGLPPIPAHARSMRPGSGVKAIPGGPWDPAPKAEPASGWLQNLIERGQK